MPRCPENCPFSDTSPPKCLLKNQQLDGTSECGREPPASSPGMQLGPALPVLPSDQLQGEGKDGVLKCMYGMPLLDGLKKAGQRVECALPQDVTQKVRIQSQLE